MNAALHIGSREVIVTTIVQHMGNGPFGIFFRVSSVGTQDRRKPLNVHKNQAFKFQLHHEIIC